MNSVLLAVLLVLSAAALPASGQYRHHHAGRQALLL
jgi:hypothetical protein